VAAANGSRCRKSFFRGDRQRINWESAVNQVAGFSLNLAGAAFPEEGCDLED